MRQNFVYVPLSYASNIIANDSLELEAITFGFGDSLPSGDPQQIDLKTKDSVGTITTVGSYLVNSSVYIKIFNAGFQQLGGKLVWIESKNESIAGAKGLTCTLRFVRVKSKCYDDGVR
jgi:hypothetical protein